MMDIIKKIKLNALETISELSVKELEEIIVYVADKYYNTSISIINDATYDLLIDFLRLRDPKSKILLKLLTFIMFNIFLYKWVKMIL